MEKLFLFTIIFILIYFFYLITVITNKKKMKTFIDTNQCLYFKNRYKLNFNKINIKLFAHLIALTNSFIIALTFTLTEEINNLILRLLIAFLILIILILLLYHFIGIIYIKKEGKQNV